MTFEERDEYVQFRMMSARRTLDAARVLAENEFWNSAVNRLYCSVFYAVNALLVWNEVQTKTHTGAKVRFSLHFVKTGRLDKKYGQLFSRLSDWRQQGDYGNVVEYNKSDVEPLFDLVEEMINRIEKEIHNYNK